MRRRRSLCPVSPTRAHLPCYTGTRPGSRPYVASTVPGFSTTSILYLEPVSSLMVRVWPNRVPSTLKKTGPSLGWIRSATEMQMRGGTSSIVPGCCSAGRTSWRCADAEGGWGGVGGVADGVSALPLDAFTIKAGFCNN